MGASPEPAQIGYAKLAQDKKALALAKKLAAEEKKKADAAKKAAKASADKLKADKAAAVLNAAAKVLDVEQAQILAALGNDISNADKDRLLLQQALLNENSDAALKLSQKIIATQLDALTLGGIDPLRGWNGSIETVIKSLIDLQKELAKVSGVALTSSQLLSQDAAAAELDAIDTSYDEAFEETRKYLESLKNGSNATSMGATDYVDDFMRRNRSSGQYDTAFQNAVINVMLDANTLTGAVTKGQQDTTASGIVVGTSRINKIGN
jgi:hypothetical protein